MEQFVIVAFNPDGTQNFLEWSNSLKALRIILHEHKEEERKTWIEDGGEYHILEVIE